MMAPAAIWLADMGWDNHMGLVIVGVVWLVRSLAEAASGPLAPTRWRSSTTASQAARSPQRSTASAVRR